MPERYIDIDDADLRAAQEALGTTSIEETVAAALRETAAVAARRREIERLTTQHPASLADREERRRPWR